MNPYSIVFLSPENATQRKIIALLIEIKEEQQRQWVVLRDLQARILGQASYEAEEEVEAVDMDLPLRTLEQLDNMEKQLEDPAAQKRMVAIITENGYTENLFYYSINDSSYSFI